MKQELSQISTGGWGSVAMDDKRIEKNNKLIGWNDKQSTGKKDDKSHLGTNHLSLMILTKSLLVIIS